MRFIGFILIATALWGQIPVENVLFHGEHSILIPAPHRGFEEISWEDGIGAMNENGAYLVDAETIEALIDSLPSNDDFKYVDKDSYDPERIPFVRIDLNGDSVLDIVAYYQQAEERSYHIWLHSSNKYSTAKAGYGSIMKFYKATDAKNYNFVVRSDFCCASEIGTYTKYILRGGKYEPQVKAKCYYDPYLPSTLIQPKPFKVQNNSYTLRTAPVIDNEQKGDWTMLEGNKLSVYTRGASGTAYATSTDPTGREWWFVLMEPISTKDYDAFYDDEGCYKIGWMSSRYLKPD